MNSFEEQLRRATRDLRLTPEEKSRLRLHLMRAMRAHPALKRAGSPSPYFPRRHGTLLVRTIGGALAVIVLMSGTAYAAQGSLPGDALYPVKIYINENVGGALAVSDEQKAAWNAEIAEERTQEAETLAAEDRLSSTTAAFLETNFEAHASDAEESARTLAQKDPTSGAQFSAQFGATLEAHGAILSQLILMGPGHASSSAALAHRIEGRAKGALALASQLAQSGKGADDEGTGTGGATSLQSDSSHSGSSPRGAPAPREDSGLATLKDAAHARLDAAKLLLQTLPGSLAASSTPGIASALDESRALIARADAAREAGHNGEARTLYVAALRQSVVVGVLLSEGKQLPQAVAPLLENRHQDGKVQTRGFDDGCGRDCSGLSSDVSLTIFENADSDATTTILSPRDNPTRKQEDGGTSQSSGTSTGGTTNGGHTDSGKNDDGGTDSHSRHDQESFFLQGVL